MQYGWLLKFDDQLINPEQLKILYACEPGERIPLDLASSKPVTLSVELIEAPNQYGIPMTTNGIMTGTHLISISCSARTIGFGIFSAGTLLTFQTLEIFTAGPSFLIPVWNLQPLHPLVVEHWMILSMVVGVPMSSHTPILHPPGKSR